MNGVPMANCIFCDIIAGRVPSTIISQSAAHIVIKDCNPKAPLHFLIIPREHLESMQEATLKHRKLLGDLLYTAKNIAEKFDVAERGYKVIINTGAEGGQAVPHLHLHFLAGKILGGLV